MLMIYQRKIDATFEKVKALRAASSLPNAKGFRKAHYLGGSVFSSSGGPSADNYVGQNSYSTAPGNMYRTEGQANGGLVNGHAIMVRDQPPSYWAAMNGGPLVSS